LLDIEAGRVRFQWKDYRDQQQKTMALSAEEFIRRFLLHVLPDRFPRIRYYGLLGNRHREQKLARCRQLLDMPPPPEPPVANDYHDRFQQPTGVSLWQCPVCQRGRMLVVEVLPPGDPRQLIITAGHGGNIMRLSACRSQAPAALLSRRPEKRSPGSRTGLTQPFAPAWHRLGLACWSPSLCAFGSSVSSINPTAPFDAHSPGSAPAV